ncbi:MAG TPA: hypothetical protein VHC49_00165 [Mycobacteriales bacterium]|nr:hypothetical protein [Mycobacteriales bacterium]
MRDVAAGEQVDDGGLVAIRVAVPLVVDHSYDVLGTDPHAAHPAGLGEKTSGRRQTGRRQRPQQRRIGSRLDERC